MALCMRDFLREGLRGTQRSSVKETSVRNQEPGGSHLSELPSRDWQLPRAEFSALLQGSSTWDRQE